MQPLLLNVDWLAVSVRFHEDEFGNLPDGHFYVDYDGTNVWKSRRIVFNEYAEKVATILFHPKSKIIAANAALIEIANEWLYHGNSPLNILNMLQHWRLFDVTGLSRVDLAVDFNPTARQWHHIVALAKGEDYISGKRSGSSFWSVVKCDLLAEKYQGKKIPHCQSWGHKTTAVKWKLYYKSKELADVYGGKLMAKPYILDCWDEAGLDRKDVWRLEVSIKNGNGQEFREEPITLDAIHHNPREIFSALYNKRFQVRRQENHADKSNDRLVPFLPIGMASGIHTAAPKATSKRNPTITLLRHLLDAIDNEEILLNDDIREETLATMERLIENANLGNYFRVVAGEDFYSFVESTRIRAADIRETGKMQARKNLRDIMEEQAKELW